MVPDPSIGSGNTGDAGNGPILGGHITSLKGGPGPSLFWSDVTVPGRPRVLILDAVEDRAGWEATATMRIAESLIRRGISVIGDAVVPVSGSDDITLALGSPRDFNCIFLTVRADNSPSMSEYWIALQDGLADGIPIVQAPGRQEDQIIVSDGAGGFYMIWMDYRDEPDKGDIYGQHVFNDGGFSHLSG